MYLKQRKVQLKLVSNYFDPFPKTKNKGTEYNSHKQKCLDFIYFLPNFIIIPKIMRKLR